MHGVKNTVYGARGRQPLTRFGIYKIGRHHAASFDTSGPDPRQVSPNPYRHTAATDLPEAGIEVNAFVAD